MTKQSHQADDEFHEDQLLNFLVNKFTDAFSLSLGEKAEIDFKAIFKSLIQTLLQY